MGSLLAPLELMTATAGQAQEKLLGASRGSFNLQSIAGFLAAGDADVSAGDLPAAQENYDNARNIARSLIAFYRDLGKAFRGRDARIPREMGAKGRQALRYQAEANLRLAAAYRSQDQPEVAVPLLVEVIRIMSPTSEEGRQAWQGLLEIGFVTSEFSG
ncbi:MAG: hypothetical protein ERJ69_00730 [Aphanocapsa feldmannii 288cV]|nr:MAG: hypothetical protein ERJ69_00730 [Aphanocapsa feldmannii 288cV]